MKKDSVQIKKEKYLVQRARESSIIMAGSQIKKKKTFKEELISQDANLRIEIQRTIRRMVEEGKTKQEIVDTLNQTETFRKYAQYFENWTKDYIAKQSKTTKKQENSKSLEER